MADTQVKTDKKSGFTEDAPLGKAVLAWWKRIQGLKGDSLSNLVADVPKPGVTGERAELRRADTVADVVFSPAYQRLRLGLVKAASSLDGHVSIKNREAEVAAIARVLVRVKLADTTQSLPRRMGEPAEEGGDKPRISELRFKRLLRIDNPTDLADVLVRLLPLLENRANPLALARDILYWNDNTRKRWANDYFQALLG